MYMHIEGQGYAVHLAKAIRSGLDLVKKQWSQKDVSHFFSIDKQKLDSIFRNRRTVSDGCLSYKYSSF
jgi:hypothetical protein